MKTAITELFGIKHPIIQGGMHYVGFAELAAAVSNAGGLGIITGLTQKTPELLAKEIARCRDMTDKPFGVNLTFLPSFTAPPYPEYIAAIREGGVKAVETAGRSPEQYMPALKAAGIRDGRGHLGEADIVHAALDDRVLDTEQFSDCCFHVSTPFSDQWTISNRPAAPMPPPMHMVTTPYFALRRRPSISRWPVSRAPVMP